MNQEVRSQRVRLISIIAGVGIASIVAVLAARSLSGASASSEPTVPSETRRTSEIVQVGEGNQANSRWSFRAYLGEGQLEGSPTDAMCMEFAFPDNSTKDDFTCFLDYQSHLEVGPVGPVAFFSSNARGAPPNTLFFGMVSTETDSITLTRENGKSYPVDLYGPFAELGDVKGFVAFVPPGQRSAHLAGYDETGAELWERSISE